MKFLILTIFTLLVFSCSNNTEKKVNCRNQEDCPVNHVCGDDNYCKKVEFCDSSAWCYEHEDFNKDTKPAICEEQKCKVLCPEDTFFDVNNNKCEELSNECKEIKMIKILSQDINIKSGQEINLDAKAYNKNNIEVLLKDPKWTSSKENFVSVNNSGVIKGESEAGTAEIKLESCGQNDSISVTNVLKVDEGKLKISIKDQNNNLITNANILINDDKFISESGEFVSDNSNEKNTISIFKEGYEYITLIDISKKDIIVYLNKIVPTDKSGGFHGDFTYPEGGNIKFGIASTSFPYSILDIDSSFMMGETFKKTVKTGLQDVETDLPSSMASPMFVKKTENGESDEYKKYYVNAIEGTRILWSYGASLSLMEILPFMNIFNGQEEINFVKLLNLMTPLMKKFHFGIKDNVQISLCNKIVDASDFNNNKNKTEKISDFSNINCFPKHDLTLNKKLEGTIKVKFPALPDYNGEKTEFIAFMTGADVAKKGFIPIGMGAASDKKDEEDSADGLVEDTSFPYVNNAQELKAQPKATLIFTGPTASSGQDPMSVISGIMNYFKDTNIPETLDLTSENFLKIASDSKLDGNKFTSSKIDGANIYRVQLEDINANKWIVYSAKNNMTLPDNKYFKLKDTKKIIQQAIKLKVDYESLFELNSENINNLSRLIEKFSRYQVK